MAAKISLLAAVVLIVGSTLAFDAEMKLLGYTLGGSAVVTAIIFASTLGSHRFTE